MFTQSNILVTGGTGSLGYELIRQLLNNNPNKIVIYTRNESAQVAMKHIFNDPRLTFCIGDIRDLEALVKACAGIDYIFHLAALKHVPICEEQPLEALKTNVIGTQNVIHAAVEKRVKKVINMSTDKAADPSNFYGLSKAIGEKLMILSSHVNNSTKFICVRGGNILGTSGSVLNLFMKQAQESDEIGITDLRMTRFFMTQQEVSELLIKAALEGKGGEVFVMAMPACRILDLAEVLIEESARNDIRIVERGIRPGEKFHEILISEYESHHAVHYDKHYIIILPTIENAELMEFYSSFPGVATQTYSSNDFLMTKDEVKQMLHKGGFLA
ncbi:polysaccharide biosynthesis protein [Paenibacillus sp. GP183]|uniref:polysaccharide biosynthesis protein n=1 Tax=Paenibacillus sp. GP183 TaxID=1882751 RepID=UPI00089698B5|nr:polysaccharide biosynthesis protein [Paenibacillus sp. GP183]SEC70429.1 Polysaccharide biosynthesis protein [Paenibacillus sp. GP183]